MSNLRLNLIAAACNNMGIGVNGTLPWTIRKDMKFFNVMSTGNPPEGKQNVAIMGKKTWFSIPPKFRPLKNRINVVLSRSLQEKPEGSQYLFDSLESAIEHLSKPEMQKEIHEVWIVGGQSVYKVSMESPLCHRIYLTKVFADIECDTFFPEIDMERFHLVSDPAINGETQEENGLKFQFLIYERKL
ncbi:hypothetical protein BSL78_11075 [Apostichopus japonicus]|uniref:dihydrofolate reductase n=1 Tax=Stichopus japonicus TaxID=307972 RepID=A0A2G8KVS0_STIJA|nr:hypothetical protein BSL78_11075 [Apostichopus japonicus]